MACSKATGVCQQGPDCFTDRSLCAENEKCIRQSTARGGARWTFACQRRCSLGSGCGPGQVCGYLDACFDSCDPSGQCAEGFQCGTVDEEGRTYGCKPLPPKR